MIAATEIEPDYQEQGAAQDHRIFAGRDSHNGKEHAHHYVAQNGNYRDECLGVLPYEIDFPLASCG
jgi:hypothetical protein